MTYVPEIMTGVGRISAERTRQIIVEGYTLEDDKDRADELALAAAVYALPTKDRKQDYQYGTNLQYELWPWEWEYFHPSPDDRIKELTKAGALIAAAIDSLRNTDK